MAGSGAAAAAQTIARAAAHPVLVKTLFIVKSPYRLPLSGHMPDLRKRLVWTAARDAGCQTAPTASDRKSVAEGKSVSVRLDPVGPRILKTKIHRSLSLYQLPPT